MHTRKLLLASLLVALYGCQQETPAQQSSAPAVAPVAEPAVVSAPVEPAAMISAPVTVQSVGSAPAAKPAPVVQEKPVAAQEMPAVAPVAKPAPVQVTAPVAKVEPVAAATKTLLSEPEVMALAKKSGCLVCHAIDKKVVGPAWRDVATKYRGDAGAEARLMDKIAKGGSGVWGSVTMPPSPKLGEADRQALARFVLSLK